MTSMKKTLAIFVLLSFVEFSASLKTFLGNVIKENVKQEFSNCMICFLNFKERPLLDVYGDIVKETENYNISFSVQSTLKLHMKCCLTVMKFDEAHPVSSEYYY